ncbi:SDH family Clp fold serine proteinase [Rheinheimera hassiensis]|uniref:SDH family Clp fold serine proteinase n=1 Tax=Rheinheimera hassiensis TaxID=1193627 RepID=UPI001F06CAB1|nr:ATP-dependent Clp protease proteolytic subunit [Rheinheimera hassiensis]
MSSLDSHVGIVLNQYATRLETEFESNIFSYYGQIHPNFLSHFRDRFEAFVQQKSSTNVKKDTVSFVINTPGGSAEMVEKMSEIIRYHFKEVHFIVPDTAMSAGTILCMSGDKIFMDYSSSLGPIDPQIQTADGKFVPALGYLDKIEEMIAKDRNNQLSNAEFALFQSQDLAELRKYEQARDLTKELLTKWLVEFKFKDWNVHRTDRAKVGKEVTIAEKRERAEEIARLLGNNGHWNSHGRMISLTKLRNELRLEIEDYTDQLDRRNMIRAYNDLLTDYVQRNRIPVYMHHC